MSRGRSTQIVNNANFCKINNFGIPLVLRFSRLGWPQEKISETVGMSRNRASEIVGNANFCNIDTLLSQGNDMDYIVWAVRLEGKTGKEKFKYHRYRRLLSKTGLEHQK